ncbi:MAG: hypothetical protein IPL59_08720 [Candidatus Competibacteraceae bacterium]|nr:hypothetical protein [Candidatus Competibacteraceae bacterium]
MAAFIGGASVHTPEPTAAITATPEPAPPQAPLTPYPWEASGIREDVAKVYNLRLPEPYLLKLKYIAEHSPASMQQFCLSLLLPTIDAKIAGIDSSPQR